MEEAVTFREQLSREAFTQKSAFTEKAGTNTVGEIVQVCLPFQPWEHEDPSHFTHLSEAVTQESHLGVLCFVFFISKMEKHRPTQPFENAFMFKAMKSAKRVVNIV